MNMNKPKDRVTIEDSFMDVVVKLSEGNPGAMNVIMQLYQNAAQIDPQDFMGGLGSVLALDTHGIYGSRIWMLYKDVCGEDLVMTVAQLRAVQLGIIGQSILDHAIDNYGAGIDAKANLTAVMNRLEQFNKQSATV